MRSAFTLIELLVVVAILAVLAAILFPVFAQAREKARQSVCLSHARQVGLALTLYVQDYDATYPWAAALPLETTPAWGALISPYVRNLALFQCPSGPEVWAAWMGSRERFREAGPRSYCANAEVMPLLAPRPTPTRHFGRFHNNKIRTLAEIPEPAHTIAILETARGGTVYPQQHPSRDSHWWWSVLNDGVAYLAWKTPNASSSVEADWDYVALLQHHGGSHYVFADGHARWLKPEATLRARQATSPTGNMWTWEKDTFPEFD
jgi:prepilin-type N-terminal cleavage/methylation domain-containing protein